MAYLIWGIILITFAMNVYVIVQVTNERKRLKQAFNHELSKVKKELKDAEQVIALEKKREREDTI